MEYLNKNHDIRLTEDEIIYFGMGLKALMLNNKYEDDTIAIYYPLYYDLMRIIEPEPKDFYDMRASMERFIANIKREEKEAAKNSEFTIEKLNAVMPDIEDSLQYACSTIQDDETEKEYTCFRSFYNNFGDGKKNKESALQDKCRKCKRHHSNQGSLLICDGKWTNKDDSQICEICGFVHKVADKTCDRECKQAKTKEEIYNSKDRCNSDAKVCEYRKLIEDKINKKDKPICMRGICQENTHYCAGQD